MPKKNHNLTLRNHEHPVELPLRITPRTYRYFRRQILENNPRLKGNTVPQETVNALMAQVLRVIARDRLLKAIIDEDALESAVR